MKKNLPKPKHSKLPLTRKAKKAKLLEAKEAAKAMSTRNPDNQIEKLNNVDGYRTVEIQNRGYEDSARQKYLTKLENPKKQVAAKNLTTKKVAAKETTAKKQAVKKPIKQPTVRKNAIAPQDSNRIFSGKSLSDGRTSKKIANKKIASQKQTLKNKTVDRTAVSKQLNSLISRVHQRMKKLKQLWKSNRFPKERRFNKNARISRFSVTNIVTVLVVILAIVTSSIFYHYKNKWKSDYNKYIEQGDEYLEADQYEEAAKSYMQAIVLKAGDEDTYLKLSEAYVEARDYQSAVRILEEANNIKVSLIIVERMNSIINIAEAAGIELETTKVKNDVAATNYQLGLHYYDAGDYTTARIYFSSASEYSDAGTYLSKIDELLDIADTTLVAQETTPPQTESETTVIQEITTFIESTTTVPETTVPPETTTQTATDPVVVERTLAEATTVSPTVPIQTEPETTINVTKASDAAASTATASSLDNSGKDNSYIIPDSNTRLLTKDELSKYSKAELRMIRNEIFAREGRLFTDPDLQAYFNKKAWYHGTIPSGEFKDSMLNDVELANVILIMELE